MRVGVVARADHGGLANQTYEVWRNVKPDRVLVVDMGLRARGHGTDLARYDAPWCEKFVTRHGKAGYELDQFLHGLDVVWSAETFYEDHMYALARGHRCATVLHANPELFYAPDRLATEIWAPTEWEVARLPLRTKVVPLPVPLDRFTYRRRTKADTFFATTGEAMLDRNGFDAVRDAMFHVEHSGRLFWRGGPPQDPPIEQWGNIAAEWLPPVDDYTDLIPAETDMLVMPRRYGGLCLPQAEAAAQGIPTVMTNLPPQDGWISQRLLVETTGSLSAKMKGGDFPVYDLDPRVLAAKLDELMDAPDTVATSSLQARQWAEQQGWDVQLDTWLGHFERLATRR